MFLSFTRVFYYHRLFWRVRGGKAIWRVISERPHGSGRPAGARFLFFLTASLDVLVPKEMRPPRQPLSRLSVRTCERSLCVSLTRADILPFVQSIVARKTLIRDGNRRVAP